MHLGWEKILREIMQEKWKLDFLNTLSLVIIETVATPTTNKAIKQLHLLPKDEIWDNKNNKTKITWWWGCGNSKAAQPKKIRKQSYIWTIGEHWGCVDYATWWWWPQLRSNIIILQYIIVLQWTWYWTIGCCCNNLWVIYRYCLWNRNWTCRYYVAR